MKKFLKLTASFFACSFSFMQWLKRLIFGFANTPASQQDKARFDDFFAFKSTKPEMVDAWQRPFNYHNLKNIWVEYNKVDPQRFAKFTAFLVVVLSILMVLSWLTTLYTLL